MISRIGLLVVLVCSTSALASDTQVGFDLPSAIECRDATPPEFASTHPSLKVIEARFRVSARMVAGNPSEIVDFVYELTSNDKTLRIHDYLPNTTLESAVADDCIEITNGNENAKAAGLEAHVAYKPIVLGGNYSQATKKTESSHYKQIAAKDLVLASGTTNREHGVFYRLRPSRAASLEGAREFTFLATVPKTWRGDLCTFSCAARGTKRSLISTSVVPAGAEQAQVGMYLAGDAEAFSLAEQLRTVQERCAAVRAAHPPKDGVFDTISAGATGLFTHKSSEAQARKERDEAEKAVLEVQTRLQHLAR